MASTKFAQAVRESFKTNRSAVIDALVHELTQSKEAELKAAKDAVEPLEGALEDALDKFLRGHPVHLLCQALHLKPEISPGVGDWHHTGKLKYVTVSAGEYDSPARVEVHIPPSKEVLAAYRAVCKARLGLEELGRTLNSVTLRRGVEQQIHAQHLRELVGPDFDRAVKSFFKDMTKRRK